MVLCVDYNHQFSLSELTDCIMKSHNTAVGPDEIHYEFSKTTSIMLVRVPSPGI